ncbi:hypothetical protein DFH08DRAFT_513600 [Mycena albidolilacea]|uniref:Uncharacterized protein n=1 Tax=Mycena albidolilacea TaxID=1033008 RepID=A0AAD6Z475_9AGAR|nr:hypothetical protein DFH08DRAFT_513600 [Mycena albidolilacea]
MPISASRPRTAQQRVDDKRAANPVLDAMFNDGLDNIHHYKTLAQGTLENHEEVRRLWRNFASYQTTYPDLATELEPKIQPIGEGAIKLFLSYLASGSKGQLDKTVTRSTMKTYLYTFLACLGRYAGQFTPPALRSQFVAFLGSDAIDPAGVLSTSSREKPIADAADIDAIIRHVWQDRILFPTNRGKVQFNTVNLISALTSQRPGAIIESGRYRGTNEALHWRDVVFTVIPNAEYPQFPHLAVGLTFRYNKGRRGQSKYYYKYTVLLEPAGERSACLVTNLLYMALEDGIFQDVDSIEEILTPRNHPTSAHTLSVKASCLSQPVCRADVVEDGIYYISLTKALMYARHNSQLHKVTFSMGFEFDFTLYVFRRAAARNFESVLTENNREALMLHTSGSHTFAKSYRSHTYNFDFGGMLHGRGRDPATEALARSASALSTGRDADTPTALDLQDVAALDREPEFVAMRQNISQLRLDADAHILALKVLDDDDPDHDEKHGDLHGRLRSAMKALRDAKSEYAQLRSQEMKIRLLAKRKEWLAGKSRRQLQAGSSRSPLTDKTSQSNRPPVVIAASGKENGEDDVPAGIKTDPTDPESALFEILYHSADPCLATEVISTVNMYAGLPIRRLPQCYPGELPTADEKCPVCKADCRRGAMGAASIGDHIHRCIGKSRVDTAVEELEAEYSPQQCAWAGCKAKAVFGTRAAFVFHLQAHLDEIDTTQDGCQWSIDGRACGDCNDQDWYCHFGSIHDLNVRTDIEVFYCVLCAIWHVDKLGDRSWWDCHLWAHYEERFRPFSTRVDDDDVDAEPIGVEFTDPFDNAVLYDPISGFDGALPEFHGHVVGGVALMAAHCLFCLFNDDLDITLRMKQFLRGDVFIKHLATHRHDIADTDDNLCPVPSCGLRKFNRFDLETHIIAFHRTPLFGTRHRKAVKYLHLPPLPALNPDSVDLDLTHIDSDPMDVDKEPPAPAPKLPKVARDRAAADERRRQAALDAPDKIEGYCCKCGKTFKDIGKHLTGSAVRCREKNEYQLINGTTRAAERLSWTAV